MSQIAREFCLKAVACLKVDVPPGAEPTIKMSESNSPVIRGLDHRLLVAYLVDEGESFTYIQYRHLKEAGLSHEELHAAAIKNLAAIAESQAKVQAYGNIYAVLMGGNFEASLLLINEFWSEWYSHLAPNGFVAAFPARDVLAFGDVSSAEAIRELNQVCERGSGKVDHPLTSTLYRRIGQSWQPLHG